LLVSGATTFTYSANYYGPYNYCTAKTPVFSTDGVVVCEAN
jgi:hypothetical protein